MKLKKIKKRREIERTSEKEEKNKAENIKKRIVLEKK